MSVYLGSNKVCIKGGTKNVTGGISLQNKTVTPSELIQTVKADSAYDGLGTVTVNAISTETKNITENGTYSPTSGKYFNSVTVNVPSSSGEESSPILQTKTVIPSETAQTITPDNGYDGLSQVSVGAISSTYVGSEVTKKSATTYIPGTVDQIILKNQYLSGDQIVKGDANLLAKNIKSGVTIFDVEGALETQTDGIDTSDATATANDIADGKTAYVNGEKLTGTHTCDGSSLTLQEKSVSPSESSQTIIPDSGYDGLSSVSVSAISSTYIGSGITQKSAATYIPSTSNQTIASGTYLSGTQTISGDSNLIASNIKSGVSIFGVAGTYTGSGSSGSGMTMKTGTTTSATIDTGLSSISVIVIYKNSLSATGLIQGVYITNDDTLHYTYCSQYSSYFKTCAVSTSTASSVSGGTFTLGTSGTSGLSSNTTYNWIAIGEE